MSAEWLENLQPHLLLVVPLLAFLEACLGIGLFVSGIFLLTIGSLLYIQGEASLPVIVALAFAGALSSDHLGFLIGYKAGPLLWKKRWMRKKLIQHKKGFRKFRSLLVHSAPWAVCIGRLSPQLRSLSPFFAGVAGLKPAQFFAYDLLACSLWATGLSLLIMGFDSF